MWWIRPFLCRYIDILYIQLLYPSAWNFSGSRRAIIHQRRSLVNTPDGELKLRIILDRFSVEVFVNDGEQVMSAAMYTRQEADGISFFADGIANIDVVKYELE